MPRSQRPSPSLRPWDLEHCPAGQLAQRYTDLLAFVSWLQEQDIRVPSCWYAHGWVVHRLAALQAWRTLAYSPGAHPRDAADWWAVGLAALQRDWEALLGHQGRHPAPDAPWDDPVPLPEFAEFVRAQVAARAHRDAEPGST